MTQLMMAPKKARTASRPLDGTRALAAASELARETMQAIAANPADFEAAIALMETVVARYRAAFLTQSHAEAEAAIAYHDRACEELRAEFAPLYYRRAVLENVAERYERAMGQLQRALA
ncbi:MAG TPA: hypothetical protein V6D47_12095 [Oscillatoriaceae cyanobacterium]